MTVTIRPEAERDRTSIWHVKQEAFGGDAEANLVDALRVGGFVAVSLVAEVDGEVVGHILFRRLSIVTNVGTVDALSLAPMAVLPSHQRYGIGGRLVEAGPRACRERHYKIVTVLGHPEFYARFGFSVELARWLESPSQLHISPVRRPWKAVVLCFFATLGSPFGGEVWMAIELVPGALEGIEGAVTFSSPFEALD